MPICDSCLKADLSAQCQYGTEHMKTPSIRFLEERIQDLEASLRSLGPHNGTGNYTSMAPLVANAYKRAESLAVLHPLSDPYVDTWTHREPVPTNIRNELIQAFIKLRWQFAFEFNVPRFMASLDLPPSHPNAPHPAFLYAILLHGCFYTTTALRRYEHVFYKRMRKELAISLASADRLLDFIRASALGAVYFFAKARYAQGHNYLSTVMKFAIACGLHRIESVSADTPFHLLPVCADLAELGDRINTFWTLVHGDWIGSLVCGKFPYSLSESEVTTVWPCPSEYYEGGRYLHQPEGNLASLHDLNSIVVPTRRDNYLALRAKGVALLHRASILSAQARKSTIISETLRLDIVSALLSTSQFATTLPPFSARAEEYDDPDAVRSILAVAIVATHATMVQLYHILAGSDPLSRERQSKAANAALTIMKELETVKFQYMPVLIGWSVTPVHEFLLREKARFAQSGDTEELERTQGELDRLDRTLRRVAELYPRTDIAAAQADIIQTSFRSFGLDECAACFF
ncbi:hypothetical protein BOTBODRAFT_37812 [Botryobasidium botryosum FD-172 SS1]|uniref:Xylanolytic transcriptional activator regulatory domain-containing protein n=1 Tax=Botryobasidium botryosum (strain FD-172 SS1) TaxID=930990 RepID=A0A067M9W5_BOTB1|nr:hypothetical protein BOTBODRAFT_37812 [Botryobasidium botryosum FD-172 SS1]